MFAQTGETLLCMGLVDLMFIAIQGMNRGGGAVRRFDPFHLSPHPRRMTINIWSINASLLHTINQYSIHTNVMDIVTRTVMNAIT